MLVFEDFTEEFFGKRLGRRGVVREFDAARFSAAAHHDLTLEHPRTGVLLDKFFRFGNAFRVHAFWRRNSGLAEQVFPLVFHEFQRTILSLAKRPEQVAREHPKPSEGSRYTMRMQAKRRIVAGVHGRVVGVGFRDYVVAIAREFRVCGTVENAPSNDSVEIDVEGEPEEIAAFLEAVETRARMPARVDRIERREAEVRGFTGFGRI